MSPLLDHLGRQVASAQRLLRIVLAQTEAIRDQDVERLLATLAEVQAEMGVRQRLETERDRFLADAAARTGCRTDDVNLETLLVGAAAPDAARARDLSAQLRGLLGEVGRVHQQNRILMRQELRFLDHLLRLVSGAPRGAYSQAGATTDAGPVRTLVDAKA